MSDDAPIIVPGVRVRRRWPALRLLRAVLGVSAALALLVGPTALTVSLALALGAAFVAVKWASDRARPARLRVTAHEVTVEWEGRALIVPRHALRQAFARVEGSRVTLALEPRFGRLLEAELAGTGQGPREEAARCVERLAFDADRRVLDFATPTLSPRNLTHWAFGGVVGGAAGALAWLLHVDLSGHEGLTAWAVAVPVGALAAWVTARAQRDVAFAVGADGVEVRMPWGRRFVPYSRLRLVDWVPPRTLVLDEEGEAPWRLEDSALSHQAGGGEAFVLAVRRAWGRSREGRHDAVTAEVVARRGRSLDEWRSALHALVGVGAGGGYRAQSLRVAELAELFDDPAAPEELRVGAALALRAMNPAAEVTRIRVAAEACAHAPMRAALERAADDTLDEAALAKLRRG